MFQEIEGAEAARLTRRNVVKGAAWSIPVIAAAVATPLAAASVTPPANSANVQVPTGVPAGNFEDITITGRLTGQGAPVNAPLPDGTVVTFTASDPGAVISVAGSAGIADIVGPSGGVWTVVLSPGVTTVSATVAFDRPVTITVIVALPGGATSTGTATWV